MSDEPKMDPTALARKVIALEARVAMAEDRHSIRAAQSRWPHVTEMSYGQRERMLFLLLASSLVLSATLAEVLRRQCRAR